LSEPQNSPNSNDKIKILIVEDDSIARSLYDKALFSQIFDKKMVISGTEAIRVYNEWHPDIIVLDIFLPEMTGYQVLKEIRTVIKDKKTTIIMATSQHNKEDVLSCMKLGVEGYMTKPLKIWKVRGMILVYYAKKEPERSRKAYVLCQEILQQSQSRLQQGQDKLDTKNDTENVCRDGGTGGEHSDQ
jgi:CheY-like chemotaxis protein